ncbi:CHAP domain-containing protein [Cryptosporangium arvum]|uniref:Uncharacterized protein n=1 Tax=Cryptosporangium arvum DSM 44712 TaxID=927661 RepID=A0A010YNW9_9ACTN|nr:CHAP domain-containing protein [Cryptosporangium arvum]EXG81870.1 hypothetical protein CryarDRAFT_2991 [Cryptosporangium arvum DSM 44712]
MRPTSRSTRFSALLTAVLVGLSVMTAASAARAQAPGDDIRQRIAQAAVSQIGQREQGTNLYPIRYKTSSAVLRPAAWCGIFANWSWRQGGVTLRPNMSGLGVAQGHWATYWQDWGRRNGRWKPIAARRAALGDAVVYGNYPASRHVGIVVGVRYGQDGRVRQVRTVEGNLRDQVTDTRWRDITRLGGGGTVATGFVSPI